MSENLHAPNCPYSCCKPVAEACDHVTTTLCGACRKAAAEIEAIASALPECEPQVQQLATSIETVVRANSTVRTIIADGISVCCECLRSWCPRQSSPPPSPVESKQE